eukprot:scpid57262/ scgid0321/ Atrial natriuretic peptide receptor 2; Atrial natriuretic peptide receptor type B; Guanylate cyclase B
MASLPSRMTSLTLFATMTQSPLSLSCPSTASYTSALIALSVLLAVAMGTAGWLLFELRRQRSKSSNEHTAEGHTEWIISLGQLEFTNQRKEQPAKQVCPVHHGNITQGCHFSCVVCLAYRRPQPRTADLNTLRVVLKQMVKDHVPSVEQLSSEVKVLSGVRGSPNVANFAGVLLPPVMRRHDAIAVVMEAGSRGSLRDILNNANMHVQLNSDFRYSLSRDIARGMDFIHRSDIGVHGHLSSFNCIVNSQWVCKVTDYGLPSLTTDPHHQDLQTELHKMLWVAPELLFVCPPGSAISGILSAPTAMLAPGVDGGQVATSDIYPFTNHVILRQTGTKTGDIYAYGIILYELLTFNVPYSESNKPLTQILERVHTDPTFRPRIPDETRIEFAELIEQCWGNSPSLRPTFPDCLNTLLQYFNIQGKSLVDVMLEQLQQRSTALQAEVDKRTQDLKDEKERFEKILHQIIPEKVTRQLQPGDVSHSNLTEVFDDVTVCFGDIVGFTRIASSLSPIEVVDLLNSLYSSFDVLLEYHGVYKLGTIGDAYMVASGVPERIGIQHAAEVRCL